MSVVLPVLLAILVAPQVVVAARMGIRFRGVAVISLSQIACVTTLVLIADAIGLRNPAGYVLAITSLVSIVGAIAAYVTAPLTRRSSGRLRRR